MRFFLVFAATMIFSFSNCQTNTPTSDSTPPVVKWVVLNKTTNTSQEITGNGTVDAKIGESYKVTLKVEDPEGVHEIELNETTSWGCTKGDFGQSHGPTLGVPEKQILEPNNEGKVLNLIFLIRDIEIGPFQCQDGFKFTGAIKIFSGRGKNYFNGETKAELVFKIPA